MARMKRKQIYIEAEQDRRLRMISRQKRTSESQLIRDGIERVLSSPLPQRRDPVGWKEALAFIDRLTDLGPVQGKRAWTREDVYDRRVFRRQ